MMLSLKSRINKVWKGWKLQPFRAICKRLLKDYFDFSITDKCCWPQEPFGLAYLHRPAAFFTHILLQTRCVPSCPCPLPSPAALALPSAGQQISRPCFLRYLCFFRLLLSAPASVALTGSHKEKQRTFTGGDANNQVYGGESLVSMILPCLFFSAQSKELILNMTRNWW